MPRKGTARPVRGRARYMEMLGSLNMDKPDAKRPAGAESAVLVHTVKLWGLNEAGICNCSKGHACGSSAGRHPVSSGWREADGHDVAGVREFCDQLRAIDRAGGVPSYGILCGEVNGIAVLDIDPRNQGWETWEEWGAPLDLKKTEAVITPRGGYHIYFDYGSIPEELRGSRKIGPGMDFLSDGKYVVGPGCMQSNGVRYVSQSPSGARSELPAVHGKGLRALKAPAWLLEKLAAAGRVEKNKGSEKRYEIAALEETERLLQWIDGTGYNEWIMVGMGLHGSYEGSEEAFEAWVKWSEKFSSFEGEGDCRGHWGSFKERSGGVGYGTLVWLALEGGMPRKKLGGGEGDVEVSPVSPLSESQKNMLERMKWERRYSGPFEDYDSRFPGFGFGMMKELAELVMKHAPQPDPLISLAGALGYFAAMFSRRWKWGGMDTRMYLIVAAPSGGGKGIIEDVINDVHKYAGMSRTLRGEPLRSDSGALAMLAEYPRRLTFTDEIGDWLMALQMSKKTGGHAFQLEALLKSAFSTNVLSLGGTAKRRAATVYDPALSLIGTTTRGALERAMSPAQFEGGLFGRFMFFIKPGQDKLAMPKQIDDVEREKDIRAFGTKMFEVNAKHIEDLRELIKSQPVLPGQDKPTSIEDIMKIDPEMVMNQDLDFDDDMDGLFNLKPADVMPASQVEAADIEASWLRCEADEAANEMMQGIQQHVIMWQNRGAGFNELLWSFWNRFPLNVRKVALISALCDNPWQPRINIAHVKWAFNLCLYLYNGCNRELFTAVARRTRDEEQMKYGKITAAVIRKVCSELVSKYGDTDEENPEISKSAIVRLVGRIYPADRNKLLDDLEGMGFIETVPGSHPVKMMLRKDEITAYFLGDSGTGDGGESESVRSEELVRTGDNS